MVDNSNIHAVKYNAKVGYLQGAHAFVCRLHMTRSRILEVKHMIEIGQ